MAMQMIIEVKKIPPDGKILSYRKVPDLFPVLKSLAESGECRFLDPLSIELKVVPERNLIRVDGVIRTTIEQACSRCLADFNSELTRSFTVRFSRESAETAKDEAPEIELDESHIGLTLFTGEAIDFVDTVQEQVVLALPYKPLCSPSCKGLCPSCGTDLNTGRCTCAQKPAKTPFAVLGHLQWPSQKQEK
jgi:uncharacterized protein